MYLCYDEIGTATGSAINQTAALFINDNMKTNRNWIETVSEWYTVEWSIAISRGFSNLIILFYVSTNLPSCPRRFFPSSSILIDFFSLE